MHSKFKSIFRPSMLVLLPALLLTSCDPANTAATVNPNKNINSKISEKLTLINNGKSDYIIIVPDYVKLDNHRNSIVKAANLLRKTLHESTRCNLPIFQESKAPDNKDFISLGKTAAAIKAGVPFSKLHGWTHARIVINHNLFLAGFDQSLNIKNRPSYEYMGTYKAVVHFLDNQAGVRFLLPGPNGIYIPKLKTLKINANLYAITTPKMLYCCRRQDELYDLANNQFNPIFYRTYGGHSYYSAVPKAKYAHTHPEYFAKIGGVRVPSQNHLCISNPEVQELMLTQMEKEFDAGYSWVQLAQTDGYKPCECEKCRAIHPDPGQRLWIIHRKLAAEMQKRRPGKKVVILSYGPTTEPPKTFTKFPDNVILELCNYSQDNFNRYKKFTNDFVVYVYNWGTYQTLGFAPKRTPEFAAQQIKFFLKNNVRGIYKCGFGENFGLEGPVYYVYGKMLENPDQHWEYIVNDYYRAAYGKARAPMKALFDSMYNRLKLYSFIGKHHGGKAKQKSLMPRTPEDMISYFFPPKLLLYMEKNLVRAKRLAKNKRVKARIRLVEREFTYLKNLASVFYYYHAYRLHPNWTTFDLLATEIERRNSLIDSWYKPNPQYQPGTKTRKWILIKEDGWPRFFDNVSKSFLKAGGRLTGTLSTPFNWNTKLLRKKRILPGKNQKSMKIRRLTEAIIFDGKPNETQWKLHSKENFQEIGMGELKEKTFFRAAYDDKYLYFAFVCDYSLADSLEQLVLGKDGAAWTQECIEIFLDPFGEREKYYHLIFNTIDNSCYDARQGFIDNPIDPDYGKEDKSWNGNWEYKAFVDIKNKKWTAEVRIPFASLGVKTPTHGVTWTMNLGRECYGKPNFRGSADLELSLWSPNLEERNFCAPSAFGNLIFY